MKRKAEDPISEAGSGTFLKKLRTSILGYIGSAQEAATDKTPQPSVEDRTLEEYAGRLVTYRDRAWCRSLPKEVSAATCAKRGWTVIDEKMLQCVQCKKMICASLPAPSKVSTRVHSFCVRNLHRQLRESHDVSCEWRFRPEMPSITWSVPERYAELKDRVKEVPTAELSDELRLCLFAFMDLQERYALSLAVAGWKLKSDADSSRLVCPVCSRELNLDVFSDTRRLNPLDEHYRYCDVVSGEVPGWQRACQQKTEAAKEESSKSVFRKLATAKRFIRSVLHKGDQQADGKNPLVASA